jgi:hypothetical protein
MGQRRECLTVRASDLRPGDRIRMLRPPSDLDLYHDPDQWRVLDPPVRIVLTGDVAVHLGVRDRDRDHGVNIRMPASEAVNVTRDVRA